MIIISNYYQTSVRIQYRSNLIVYNIIINREKKIVGYTIFNPTWVEGKKYKCQQLYSTCMYYLFNFY